MASFAEKLILAANEDDEDENEEDYVPEVKEEKEYEKELLANMPEKQRKKLERKLKNVHKRKQIVKKAWEQMQQDNKDNMEKASLKIKSINDLKKNSNELNHESIEIANRVLDEFQKKDIKKVRFAGKDFLVDDKGNIMQEEIKEQEQENKENEQINGDIELYKIKQGFQYMNQLMEKIKVKTKTLNSLSKSKYDWKNYAKKEKIETQLEQNRKGGYLHNQNFIEKSRMQQKELSKQTKKVKFTD
ncbi:hypothetical protein PPERSA_12609 [Pseudocohnilembus persalinus]|uniref:BCNT-C domain-containing protein n=1 Tax=Pseudocohnilembus persalinus TaxID=266149 RepID=A0A0V0QCG4_PSEPJ|nr:hypothetical protein PPERSA_12609 [Pseudocohnilembus persalinus]|eukprot:KRW99933.1 hypothetical protein PPERSA_12609 [Pseudocohnilembus persalinus]